MCVHMHVNMYADICVDLGIDMCANMCVGIGVDMGIDRCANMCVDVSVHDMCVCRHMCAYVHAGVRKHV